MNYAYIREPLKKERIDELSKLIEPYGIDKWYIDDSFEKAISKHEYRKMLDNVCSDDIVVIYDFTNIAKNVSELADVSIFFQKRNIKLVSIKDDFDSTTDKGSNMIDTIVFLSNFEKEAQVKRQKEGIEFARREGKNVGRSPIKISKQLFDLTYNKYMNRKITKIEFSEIISVTRPTLDKFIKTYETNTIALHNGYYFVETNKQ